MATTPYFTVADATSHFSHSTLFIMTEGTASQVARRESNSAAKNWAWTINNPRQDMVDHLNGLDLAAVGIRYICWGVEVAPTTGTPHLQGFL